MTTRKTLQTAAVLILALACAQGAVWTAYWSLRFGLTPRPPLPAFQTAVRFAAVTGAVLLWPFRRDPLERTLLLCTVLAAGASALFGLGLRSTANDFVRLLFHFFAYSLGVWVSVRWLERERRGLR
jgi:hypothetical protein